MRSLIFSTTPKACLLTFFLALSIIASLLALALVVADSLMWFNLSAVSWLIIFSSVAFLILEGVGSFLILSNKSFASSFAFWTFYLTFLKIVLYSEGLFTALMRISAFCSMSLKRFIKCLKYCGLGVQRPL